MSAARLSIFAALVLQAMSAHATCDFTFFSRPPKCERPEHGREFVTKRDRDCGVERVTDKVVTNADCGVKEYNSCRREEFGIEAWVDVGQESASDYREANDIRQDRDKCLKTIVFYAKLMSRSPYKEEAADETDRVPRDIHATLSMQEKSTRSLVGDFRVGPKKEYCSYKIQRREPLYNSWTDSSCGVKTYNTCKQPIFKMCQQVQFGYKEGYRARRNEACGPPKQFVTTYESPPAWDLDPHWSANCVTCDKVPSDRIDMKMHCLAYNISTLANHTRAKTLFKYASEDTEKLKGVYHVPHEMLAALLKDNYKKDGVLDRAGLLGKASYYAEHVGLPSIEVFIKTFPEIESDLYDVVLPYLSTMDQATYLGLFKVGVSSYLLNQNQTDALRSVALKSGLPELARFRIAELYVRSDLNQINKLSNQLVKLLGLHARLTSSIASQNSEGASKSAQAILDFAKSENGATLNKVLSFQAATITVADESSKKLLVKIVEIAMADLQKTIKARLGSDKQILAEIIAKYPATPELKLLNGYFAILDFDAAGLQLAISLGLQNLAASKIDKELIAALKKLGAEGNKVALLASEKFQVLADIGDTATADNAAIFESLKTSIETRSNVMSTTYAFFDFLMQFESSLAGDTTFKKATTDAVLNSYRQIHSSFVPQAKQSIQLIKSAEQEMKKKSKTSPVVSEMATP
ncbi:MAG: hypothetical protein EOP05_01460 [Proteobacteria bacterium]|nr:MAG: hypothetical protein EOP05_01460 [Pseudomonadota bacterium]